MTKKDLPETTQQKLTRYLIFNDMNELSNRIISVLVAKGYEDVDVMKYFNNLNKKFMGAPNIKLVCVSTPILKYYVNMLNQIVQTKTVDGDDVDYVIPVSKSNILANNYYTNIIKNIIDSDPNCLNLPSIAKAPTPQEIMPWINQINQVLDAVSSGKLSSFLNDYLPTTYSANKFNKLIETKQHQIEQSENDENKTGKQQHVSFDVAIQWLSEIKAPLSSKLQFMLKSGKKA